MTEYNPSATAALKPQRKTDMTKTFYAVAYRKTDRENGWNGLASYSWYSDPSRAEELCAWLRKNHPIFSYQVATVQIEEPEQND